MSYMRNEASDFEKQILKESVVIPSSNSAIQVSYEMAAITTGRGRGLSSLLPRPSTALQLKLHERIWVRDKGFKRTSWASLRLYLTHLNSAPASGRRLEDWPYFRTTRGKKTP